MFLNKIDWKDPKFSRWHLSKLGALSNAQKEAFWDHDEIDHPPITENEQIELCKQFDCRIELFHSNVCYGVEKSWPKKYFGVADFKSLPSRKQKQLHKTMEKHAVSIYKKYVNHERRKQRIMSHNESVFAPFWEERRCRLRFKRINQIGEMEIIQKNPHESTSNEREVSALSKGTTPVRRLTRSTFSNSKGSPRAKETETPSMTHTQLSPNVTRHHMEKTPSKSQHNMSNHPNTRSYFKRTFDSFTSDEANQTVINTQSMQSTHQDDLSFSVDTPNFDSPQGGLDIFSQNLGTPTVNQQPSTHVATNKTPELSVDESNFNLSLRSNMSADRNRLSNNNLTEENYSEDFAVLDDNFTSTQENS